MQKQHRKIHVCIQYSKARVIGQCGHLRDALRTNLPLRRLQARSRRQASSSSRSNAVPKVQELTSPFASKTIAAAPEKGCRGLCFPISGLCPEKAEKVEFLGEKSRSGALESS